MPDLRRELLDARREQRQRGEIRRMSIALHDLARYRIRLEAELRTHISLDLRGQMRERPHGTRQLADCNLLAHSLEPPPMSLVLLVPNGQLEAERNRLAMNPVRASHHDGVTML